MNEIKDICSSWSLYSTIYYPMLQYRKYDGTPIYENCEFIAIIKETINNIPYFAKIYIKLNENTHIIKELENYNKMIDWEVIENGDFYQLVVKGKTSTSNDYIQVKLENYRNRGFVELLNYKEPFSIDGYTKVIKTPLVEFIRSGCAALSYKYFGSVTVYNQQYNISKFIVLQEDTQRNTILYAEFILRVINGTPILILGTHSSDFTTSYINIHAVKEGAIIKLYWQNLYSSITNHILIKKLVDMNSSSNEFTLDNSENSISSLTPTVSLL